MEQDYKDLLRRLKARFDSCYAEKMAEILKLDKAQIMESAAEIAAFSQTHMEISFWLELSMYKTEWPVTVIKSPFSAEDATYLLSLENPLKDLALKWWLHTIVSKADFHEFFRTTAGR